MVITDTKSVVIHDTDMGTIMGALTLDSHTRCNYIHSAKHPLISEPVPVKNIDYMDETPLSTVKDTIDREPKDGDVWTKIVYIRDKEENNQDGIYVCVNHRDP